MNPPLSLQPFDTGCHVVDRHGRTYTAYGFTPEPDDRFGVEIAHDGEWLTLERGDVRQRFPLRHGDNPHWTDLAGIRVWPNPFLPEKDNADA